MMKPLTSLFLLIVFGIGAVAGMPMHDDVQKRSMSGMMECCEKARSHSQTPEVASAKLCCALNCRLPGSTVPTSQTHLNLFPNFVARHPATVRSSFIGTNLRSPRFDVFQLSQKLHSPPAYISHLALLI